MKLCRACGTEKSIVEFGIRAASNDGLSAKCKSCQSEYDKQRANLPHRVKARKVYAGTEQGLAAGAKAKKAWAQRNQLKRKAHIAVGNAIRDGKLIKELCEVCGAKEVHAHHDDYSKPLEVRWLCPAHHAERHK